VQPARQIDRAAIQIVKTKPPRRQMPFTGQFLSLPLIRNLVASVMKNQVSKKVSRTHYPAPFAIIDLWRDHFGDKKRMMEEEANSVARLIQGETVLNLIRVFFLQNQLKNQVEDKKFNPQHVHVIGAGIMGGDIAAWCALKGMTVTLEDREPKYLSNAIGRANKLFNKKLRTVHERNAVSDRLIPDTHGYGVANADVIIEAIFEDIEAKQAIYERIEPRMKPDAILATNTSSIPLETLSSGLKDPERLVGIHFFNPVAIMPLVEIVKTSDTSPKTVAKAATFVQKIGKLPLPVRSSPGFLVNRILLPYLVEAMILYNEGIAIEAIDKAALDFGMPMGPIELADTVGLDICQSVAQNLSRTFNYDLPPILESYIKAGNLGKKTGRGIYRYKKGKPVKDKDASLGDQKIIQKRLIYRLLNEAASCLEEGIVENVNLLDAGIIFGTGFAPFRGGPLHYSQSIGLEAVIADLEVFADKYGSGFKPSSGWKLIGD
ncbi:MAG: 3-hydroxyacyl-CoA dehydrogenase/enoyl-CoA hydratase/3-hydroxybutyryl-CoA epimerase, partial [Gammaproteobacteria bacterium]